MADAGSYGNRVWQPACEAIGLATITHATIVLDSKRMTTRTYQDPVPYDLRHSPAGRRTEAMRLSGRRRRLA